MESKLKILLLSAYHADSHAVWANTLIKGLPGYDWTLISLPPRYFSWRVRGNSLSWAFGEQRALLEQEYDLLITTSMVDLSALRGFCPSLALLPTLVYFHENQFGYPQSGREFSSVEPQLLSIYTALCGDRLLFNSEFNRTSFLQGAAALLKKLPDQVPAGVVERLSERSSVLPVPLNLSQSHKPARALFSEHPVRLLWNARWEFDKGPERLLNLLDELETAGLDFELSLLGQRFRKVPEAFYQIRDRYQHRLVQFGYAESAKEYRKWLEWSDIVLSTALHEFQGLAVLEAVAAGAVPLLPDRQVYPELFAPEFIYTSDLKEPQTEARAAASRLVLLIDQLKAGSVKSPDITRFEIDSLLPEYARMIESLRRSG